MNREVLFRAFDKKLGRLLEVISIDFENDFIMLTDGEMRTSSSFNNCILEQFTGLYDKNGTKIFEGDVLTTKGCAIIITVVYSERHNNLVFQVVSKTKAFKLEDFYLYDTKSLSIIGNIHDKEVAK